MEKNQLIKLDGVIYRVLAVEEQNVLLIDCIKRTMPKWYGLDEVSGHEICPEEELGEETEMVLEKEEDLKPRQRCVAHERFTVVAGILPFLDDDKMRATVIRKVSGMHGISVQTVRKYLCQYLVYQSISALIPKERAVPERGLTKDEKNFRWALNKFYFTRHKNSLKTAYTYMLKEKYCDGEGFAVPWSNWKLLSTMDFSSGLRAGKLINVTPSSVICENVSDLYSLPMSDTMTDGIWLESHCSLLMKIPNLLHHSTLSAMTLSIKSLSEYVPPSHVSEYPMTNPLEKESVRIVSTGLPTRFPAPSTR